MVALTFYPYRKVAKKPHTKEYPVNPATLGEHVRKKRIESGQLQKDAARTIGVSEDTITYWENNRAQPLVTQYPGIFAYLGYYPFTHDAESLAGKIVEMRYRNGWSREILAAKLGVDATTIFRWETRACAISQKKLLVLNALIYQFLTTQHRLE